MTVESVHGNQVYLEWIGTSESFGIVAQSLEFLSSVKLRLPPLELRREHQDRSREMDHHVEMRREKQGSSWVVVGPSVLLSSQDGYVRELLELHQVCHGLFRGSRETVRFVSRYCSGKGPHLMWRGESPGFSRVATGNLCFLSNYGGDLRDPLVLPQECHVSRQVARGLSGFLSRQCRGLGFHLRISGFLSNADTDLRVPMCWGPAPMGSRITLKR